MFRQSSRRETLFREALARKAAAPKKRSLEPTTSFSLPWAWWMGGLWFLFGAVGAYMLLWNPEVAIDTIIIQGSAHIPSAALEQSVEQVVAGRYWNAVSRRNFFFLPVARIESQLLSEFPLIDQIALRRSFPNRLEVTIVEKPWLLLWCSAGPCVLIDVAGRAVMSDRAFDALYDERRLMVVDSSGAALNLGAPLDVRAYLDTFAELRLRLEQELGVATLPIALTPSKHSGELHLTTGAGWKLLVGIENTPDETIAVLKAFLLERVREKREKQPLQSVDIRIPGKLFFNDGSSQIVEPEKKPSAREEEH